MNGYGFRAYVLRDAPSFTMNTARLIVVEDRGATSSALRADGTWVEVPQGQTIADAGIVLPAHAIEAIGRAIADYQGNASHEATESKVLREWLAVERGRVDRALGSSS